MGVVDRDQNDSRLAEGFDRIAPQMWREYKDPGDSVYGYAIKTHVLELLQQLDHPRILDAGGGTGRWSIMLSRLGYDVVLIDISPASIEIATRNAAALGVKFRMDIASVEHTSHSDGSFDFVMALGGVITYTPHPDAMLDELIRVLRPGGMLLVDYYSALGWAIRIRRAELTNVDEGWLFNPQMRYPERAFSHSRMEQLLRDRSLSIVRKIGYGLTDLSVPEDSPQDTIDEVKAIALAVSRNQGCFDACAFGIMAARKGRATSAQTS